MNGLKNRERRDSTAKLEPELSFMDSTVLMFGMRRAEKLDIVAKR